MSAKNILIVIVVICLVGAGCFIGGRCSVKPDIQIVEKEPVKEKPRPTKQIEAYTPSQCAQELLKWETSEARLDGFIEGDKFHSVAGLNDREWSRDFKLKASVNDSNNVRDKLLCFFGGMVAGGLIGGAVDFKIQQAFK